MFFNFNIKKLNETHMVEINYVKTQRKHNVKYQYELTKKKLWKQFISTCAHLHYGQHVGTICIFINSGKHYKLKNFKIWIFLQQNNEILSL